MFFISLNDLLLQIENGGLLAMSYFNWQHNRVISLSPKQEEKEHSPVLDSKY